MKGTWRSRRLGSSLLKLFNFASVLLKINKGGSLLRIRHKQILNFSSDNANLELMLAASTFQIPESISPIETNFDAVISRIIYDTTLLKPTFQERKIWNLPVTHTCSSAHQASNRNQKPVQSLLGLKCTIKMRFIDIKKMYQAIYNDNC